MHTFCMFNRAPLIDRKTSLIRGLYLLRPKIVFSNFILYFYCGENRRGEIVKYHPRGKTTLYNIQKTKTKNNSNSKNNI